jgi:hypothetical protein
MMKANLIREIASQLSKKENCLNMKLFEINLKATQFSVLKRHKMAITAFLLINVAP